MSLKSIELTLSDRQILSGVLTRQEEVKVPIARKIREVATNFHTEASAKMLDRLNREVQKLGVPLPTWSDLADIKEYLHRTNEALTDEDPNITPVALKDYEETLIKPLAATIDKGYLEWLRDELADLDWSKAKVALPTGEQRVVNVPVSVGQSIAIATVADKIDEAIASEDVKV